MKVTIWGTRGSVPVSTPETVKFGGNTTCVEVVTDAGDVIILDAGTGIRELGQNLSVRGTNNCAICFTHGHWDHMQGLPFFNLLYDDTATIDFYVPLPEGQDSSGEILLSGLFNSKNFPIGLDSMRSAINMHDFTVGTSFSIGSALVETCPTAHPGGCCSYKITADGWTFVFSGDHEWGAGDTEVNERFEAFITRADVLLADAQYTASEYPKYKGWGHSAIEDWPERCVKRGVRRLIFTHHDPDRTDRAIETLYKYVLDKYAGLPIALDFAYERLALTLPLVMSIETTQPSFSLSQWLCEFSSHISHFSDTGMILDTILTEARKATDADSGTIYMVEEDKLVFSFTQNASLFSAEDSLRQVYQGTAVPIDTSSIAGYVATTRKPLIIDNVRNLMPHSPYSFNDSFDQASGYMTVSMLVVPLLLKDNVVGVIQLINKLSAEGNPIPFTGDCEARIGCLSSIAANALERGIVANELILRMLSMASLRDPAETASHVTRVGAIAAEVYQQWAMNRGIGLAETKRKKDHIRLAAMLHDVGKVGVPDAILKKKGPLTQEERTEMQRHCYYGMRLFGNINSGIELMARDIALNHHQRWDGKGYTGHPDYPLLAGEEIPIAARIASVSDVYDALVSMRSYKKPYKHEFAYAKIVGDSGKAFDPEVVNAFVQVIDIIRSICVRYPESEVENPEFH